MCEIGDFKPRKGNMNTVILMGRLTKDPEVKYTPSQTAYARFSIAISRGKDKDGKEMTDYPTIVTFGKTAETVEKYTKKGMMVAVTGKIQTGSYEKDGKKVYTTSIVADRVEFAERRENPEKAVKRETPEDDLSMFSMIDDDSIPF